MKSNDYMIRTFFFKAFSHLRSCLSGLHSRKAGMVTNPHSVCFCVYPVTCFEETKRGGCNWGESVAKPSQCTQCIRGEIVYNANNLMPNAVLIFLYPPLLDPLSIKNETWVERLTVHGSRLNVDKLVKIRNLALSSFRRKPESSIFNRLQTTTFCKMTMLATFCKTINL